MDVRIKWKVFSESKSSQMSKLRQLPYPTENQAHYIRGMLRPQASLHQPSPLYADADFFLLQLIYHSSSDKCYTCIVLNCVAKEKARMRETKASSLPKSHLIQTKTLNCYNKGVHIFPKYMSHMRGTRGAVG